MSFSRGDIVETKDGRRLGVVVGFPSPNVIPPTSPYVLFFSRDGIENGGFECAYSVSGADETLRRIDSIPETGNDCAAALAWYRANRGEKNAQ